MKTPAVTVTLASKVVSAMILAAMRSFPPKAFTMTKLAAAVGLAKNRHLRPSSRPSNPASQAASVHTAGEPSIFHTEAPSGAPLSVLMAFRAAVAPMHRTAGGRARDGTQLPHGLTRCGRLT